MSTSGSATIEIAVLAVRRVPLRVDVGVVPPEHVVVARQAGALGGEVGAVGRGVDQRPHGARRAAVHGVDGDVAGRHVGPGRRRCRRTAPAGAVATGWPVWAARSQVTSAAAELGRDPGRRRSCRSR